MTNKFSFLFWCVGVFTLHFTGCAWTDITLDLPYKVANSSSWKNENNEILLHPIEESRPFTHRIGMKKNGYNMDTANVLSRQNVLGWLENRLTKELSSAGFKVVNKKSEQTGTELTTTLYVLFVEPIVQFSTVDSEADVSLLLHVKRKNGLVAEKRYYVKGTQSSVFVIDIEEEYTLALNKAIDQLMVMVVNDLIELFVHYK